ncbi:MAG: hybrid sensor histidine kinase/response regulator [Anaerolineales bacterium]|nr:hybrid sensor histidine kinase/response regulator [Anaerolineales bacterium]
MSVISEILIVDDRPQNLYTLERLLKRLDLHVFRATSGNEALELAIEHDFCVAIVDVQMPEMDGYELVDLLRGYEKTATLPVIFVSAIFSDEYHHRKAYASGAVDFISKPFNPEILLSKVKVFMDLYHQRRRLQELVEQVSMLNENLEALVNQRTAELQKAYQALEKMDRNKSDFINIAAHELRTPLTLMIGYNDMLQEITSNLPEAQRMLKGIANGQERLLEVVDSMLYVSKIENNILEACKQPVRMIDILAKVLRGLSNAFEERKISLTVEGIENLPIMLLDPELMEKLLDNLITNAIKFTPDGGRVNIHGQMIEPASAPESRKVQMTVADTGIGIDPKDHELIFKKFFQTGPVEFHSTSRTRYKGGGPGLGLAIARGIAIAHHGSLWVESAGYDEEKLPGSAFHLLLPVETRI